MSRRTNSTQSAPQVARQITYAFSTSDVFLQEAIAYSFFCLQ